MARRRLELRVDGFVAEVHEVGLAGWQAGEPIEGVVGQFVGDVALLRNAPAVDIQAVPGGVVRALATEADPVIEARLRIVALAAHVPFAEEAGLVAGLLQIGGKEDRTARDRRVVVDDLMLVGIGAGEDGSAGWAAEGRGDEGVPEVSALGRDAIHVRGFEERLGLEETHGVVAVVVGKDENDIAAPGLGLSR